MRIQKGEMYLRMAAVAAERSACKRMAVGAIITDRDMRTILSVGYNGPPTGAKNDCPGDPETAGACGCTHAEVNALLKAPFDDREQVMFLTLSPCPDCARLILNSRVKFVYYWTLYRLREGVHILNDGGVECRQPDWSQPEVERK